MENIVKLLGKPVINIYDGKLEGYVKNFLTDKKLKKIVWLEIFDDENQDEKILYAKNIFALDKDAIMIKNSEKIYLSNTINSECINPIGYKVYNINGKYENYVNNISFNNSFNIESITLQGGNELNKSKIVNVGDKIIIKSENKIKMHKFKPKSIINLENALDQKVETLSEENKIYKIKSHPNKILTAGSEFLIGRKVGQNIYTETKQLLVKKNSKITNQIIDIASANGKLKELTTYSIM